MAPARQAIVGAAFGYQPRALTPLIRSLVKSEYKGDTWLLVSESDLRLESWLHANGVRTIRVGDVFPYAEIFAPAASQAPQSLSGMSPHVRRYFMYRLFMRTVGRSYDLMMLSDTRDVIFQKDPFDFPRPAADVLFVLEDRGKSIGACTANSAWVRNAFGEAVLSELGDKPISCSGTMFGNLRGLTAYLDRFVDLAVSRNVTGVGGDQGIHNYIVHRDPIPDQHVFENEDGPVLTLHWKPAETLQVGSDGIVKNARGAIPNVVHQYDRHPRLLNVLERKYCGALFHVTQRIRRAF